MTTPRVTVPVDYETMSELHTLKGWLHGLANHPDLCDVVADGGVTSGMVYQQDATEFAGRLRRILDGPISAAPAPEGGAVKKACVDFQEAIDDFEAEVADVMAEGSERADLWDREITVNIDALKTVMSAALATREEAPAEAGKPCGAEAAAVIRQFIKDREDAQPVAWRCSREWPSDGLGKWQYHDGPPNPSHLARNVQALFLHPVPAPDALRVVVEALEYIDNNKSIAPVWVQRRVRQALAALQAEQKGGA